MKKFIQPKNNGKSSDYLKLWRDMTKSVLEIPLWHQCRDWREESEKKDSWLLKEPGEGIALAWTGVVAAQKEEVDGFKSSLGNRVSKTQWQNGRGGWGEGGSAIR